MLQLLSIIGSGFSIAIAVMLLLSYTFFISNHNKTIVSIIFCGLILMALSALQFEHLAFLLENADPLSTKYYQTLLLIIPSLFYLFSRLVLFPAYNLTAKSLFHFLPLLALFLGEVKWIVPVAFIIGTGYCLWILYILYELRAHRKRFEIEFFFFSFFSLLAFIVLIIGSFVSYVDNQYFYYFYANGITFAYVLVTMALIIYPDLLNELTEAVKLGYANSTLVNIDVDEKLKQLDSLMNTSKLFQNENLNLSSLADAMSISSHQLSELVNTRFNVNFSRYLREVRIGAAKTLLKNEPQASILSISLETGFKSQSNFYAAFKEVTGQSPSAYRKTKTS